MTVYVITLVNFGSIVREAQLKEVLFRTLMVVAFMMGLSPFFFFFALSPCLM